MVANNDQQLTQPAKDGWLPSVVVAAAEEGVFRDQWKERKAKERAEKDRKRKLKYAPRAKVEEEVSIPDVPVDPMFGQIVEGDVFQRDGKWYSRLEQNQPFDSAEDAASRYQQNVYLEGDPSRGIKAGTVVEYADVGGDESFAGKGVSDEPDPAFQKIDDDRAKAEKIKFIKLKSRTGVELTNDDLFFIAENLSDFEPRKNEDGTYDEKDHITVPNWYKWWLAERDAIGQQEAEQAGRVMSLPDIKDVASMRGPLTDKDIIFAASKSLPKDVVKSFESGVAKQRKERLEPAMEEAGVSSDKYDEYAKGRLDLVVEDTIRPAGKMYRAPVTQDHLNSEFERLGLTGHERKQVMQRFRSFQESGDIDENGHADPKNFIATVLGKSGISFLPKHRTSIGPVVNKGLSSLFEMGRAAQKNWDETVGESARQLYQSEGYLNIPGSPEAKLGMWIYNGGQGLVNQFKGLVDLVSWDNVDKVKLLKNIYKDYLLDRQGNTPLLRQEIDMIEAEANSEMAAELVAGIKEAFYQLGGIVRGEPGDTADALFGDPVGTLANRVLIGRTGNALSGLGVPADKLSKFQRNLKEFLAKADAELTGIPTAARVAGAAFKAPVWLAEKVSKNYGPLARQFFTSPTRLELAVRRAKEQGVAVEADVASISKNIEKFVGEGMSQADATQKAMSGVSKKSADFYARTVLDNIGFSHGAKQGFLQTLDNPQEVVTAIIANDAKALRDALPEQVLEQAGIKPAMQPNNMTGASKKKGVTYETLLVDPSLLMKQFDDAFVQLEKLGRGAEVQDLLSQVQRAYGLIGKRKFKYPLIRPGSKLKDSTSGVPKVFDQNLGISNRALLLAMLLEAKGRPVPVTVMANEVSYFKGPLVGPPDVVNKIPVADRTRLKVYESSGQSKAGDMLERLNRDEVSDYALYLRRAQNLARKDPETFAELKEAYLEKTGLTEEQFNQTRLGGVAAGVDNMIEELIVRRTPRAPGAEEAIPSLFGVKRPKEYLAEEGVPAVGPTGDAFDIDPTMSPRVRQTTKGHEKYGGVMEDMESARIQEARRIKEEMITPEEGASFEAAKNQALERVKRGESAFTQAENQSILDTVIKAKSDADITSVQKALGQRARVAKEARRQMVSDVMARELEVSATISAGGAWPEDTVPLVFRGAADAAGAALANSQGARGARVASMLEAPTPATQQYLNVGEGVDVSVPNFVNDAFAKLKALDELADNPNWLQKGLKGVGMIKRAFTSRSVPTGLGNVSSGYILRGTVTGRFNPSGLVKASDDVKTYLTDPKKLSPEDLEIMRTMDDKGVFSSTIISQETIDKGMARFPTEVLEDWLEGKPLTRPARAALKKYNAFLKKHERYYNMTDPVFKVDHVQYLVPKYMETTKKLSPGKYMDFDVGKGLSVRVFRNADGTYRYGRVDGRVIPESELRKYATEKAIKSANDIYFDYMDVPGGVDMARKSGADVLGGNPVFTWGWKATHLPGVKRGLQHELTYGGRGFNTNDPAIRADVSRRLLADQVFRVGLMNAFAATARDDELRTPEGREMARRFDTHRQGSVKVFGGPMSSRVVNLGGMNPWGRQGDVGNAAASLLVKNKEELLNKYIEKDMGAVANYVVDRIDKDYRKSFGGSKDQDLINQRASQYLQERLNADPDWLAKEIVAMRRNSALFQQDKLKALGTIFNLSEPLYKDLSRLGDDPNTTMFEDIIAKVVIPYGTSSATMQGLAKIVPKLIDGKASMDDVYSTLRIKKLPNRYINKTLDKIKKNQMDAYERDRGISGTGVFGRENLSPLERIDQQARRKLGRLIQDLDQLALEKFVFEGLSPEVMVKQPDTGTGRPPRLRVEDSLGKELEAEEAEGR